MTLRDRAWLAVSLLGAAWLACRDVESPDSTPALDEAALLAHVEYLAADELLGRRAGSPGELKAAQYVRARFEAAGLEPGVSDFLQEVPIFPLGASQLAPPADSLSHNVLGVLPGRGSLAAEWVVVGAHYDHLGWRRVSADSIEVFNGADDNASGTAVLIEVARYLLHHFQRGAGSAVDHRSLMFQAYGAEEIGLVGSDYFCAHPTMPLDGVAAMVNLDMVGRLGSNLLRLGGTASSSVWQQAIAAGNVEGLDLLYEETYVSRSDQRCFYEAGRPVMHVFTGLHEQYHTPWDDVALLNLAGMAAVGRFAAGVVLDLATRSSAATVGN